MFTELSFVLIFLITAVVVVNVNSQSSCTTVRQEEGVCVPQSECTTITTLIKLWGEPVPPQVVRFINSSKCATFGDAIYVCCEKESVSSQRTPATQARPPTVELDSESRTRSCDGISDMQCGMSVLRGSKCEREDANFSEHPWIALLVYSNSTQRAERCTGTLITDQYVLTTAHCLTAKGLVSVRLGMTDTREPSNCNGNGSLRRCDGNVVEIDIEEVVYHKDLSYVNLSNDIGLIRLSTRVTLAANIRPICLPVTPQSQAIILDYGMINGLVEVEPGNMRSFQNTTVQVVNNDHCSNILKPMQITGKQICIVGGNDLLGYGTAGSPLYISTRFRKNAEFVQYGLVSAGRSSKKQAYPTIFVNVISYLPWIAGGLRP